jgi:hypothetical protein
MSNTITAPTPTEVLEREIRATVNNLGNAIACRRDHPSYGYTKAGIIATLSRLEGLLQAHHIMTTGEASATWAFDAHASAKSLNVELSAWQARAKAA